MRQITIVVDEDTVAKMREHAAGNEELESKTDDELIEWMEESLQSCFDNGDLMADQFDY